MAALTWKKTKHLLITMYDALHNCAENRSSWRSLVTGLKSSMLGINTQQAGAKFSSSAMEELKATGVLLQAARARC